MLKVMQNIYPIIVNTQMDVIKKYGLPEGREGEKRILIFFKIIFKKFQIFLLQLLEPWQFSLL